MHYDGKNEKAHVIIFFEIYLFFKFNLKKHRFSIFVSSLFIVRFEKFQMLLTAKFIVIKLHKQFNWFGTKAKMFQQHDIFSFYKIKKNHYSGLTAGCNLKLATYVDIPILKNWSKLHYPAANQTQVIGPQQSLKSLNLHVWNGDNFGLTELILVKLLLHISTICCKNGID